MANDGQLIGGDVLVALFRQRRQLLVISILLVAIHLAGIKIGEITLSGLKLPIDRA